MLLESSKASSPDLGVVLFAGQTGDRPAFISTALVTIRQVCNDGEEPPASLFGSSRGGRGLLLRETTIDAPRCGRVFAPIVAEKESGRQVVPSFLDPFPPRNAWFQFLFGRGMGWRRSFQQRVEAGLRKC